jgi:hypothetical protein
VSYIRAKKVEIQEGDASHDGAVRLELPDHDMAGSEMELDMNLDDEVLDFVLGLINQVNELPEGEALVVWKVVF